MAHLMSLERIGFRHGIQESVIDVLQLRFEVVDYHIEGAIKHINDVSVLQVLLKKAVRVDSLEEFMEVVEKIRL